MDRFLTRDNVRKHAAEDDAWLIIDNVVWDVTGFAEEHPGGAEIIVKSLGRDASTAYNAVHSPKMVLGYFGPSRIVGRLDEGGDLADSSSSRSQLITKNRPMTDLSTLVNLHDIERVALECLPPLARAQISAGANDNRTTKANASSFQDIYFRPRVLCSSRRVDCKTRILGREYALPIFNAPA